MMKARSPLLIAHRECFRVGHIGLVLPGSAYFIQRLRDVFEHPKGGKRAVIPQWTMLWLFGLKLHSVWVDDTLKLFHNGLNNEVQSELAYRDEGRTLDQFIDLAICIDNLVCSRQPNRNLTSLHQTSISSDDSEPMQKFYGGTRTLYKGTSLSVLWPSRSPES